MRFQRSVATATIVIVAIASGTALDRQMLRAQSTAQNGTTGTSVTASADHSPEAYVVEQSRTIYRFEKDGTGRRETYQRVKVQSEAGVQQWGQLVLPYNAANERMEIRFVRVHKADGTVVTAHADAVQDLTSAVQRVAPVYTDTREKHVTVPGLRPGETLEFSVATTVHTALAPGHFWAEHEFNTSAIVLDEQLQIDVPKDRAVTLKTRPGAEPLVTEEDDRRLYRWNASHLTSDDEDRSKSKKLPKKSSSPEPPDVRLTTFPNWEAVGRWYATLERPQRRPTPEIRKKAVELTAGRTTDLDKLEALYEYVATNFRYVSLSFGVGRYQPHAALDVLHHEYGDCKDKHTLLASLAESIGLQPSAALINSRIKLDPGFPSPSQFDHVMTRVAVGTEAVWLDTTLEVAPFRLLAPDVRQKQALVVDENGPAHLEESPAEPPMPSATVADVNAKIDESGTLSAHVRIAASGDFELLLRTLFRRTPNSRWKAILDSITGRQGLDGDVTDWHVADPAALREPFTIEYREAKANFVTWTEKQFELHLPLADFVSVGPSEETESDDTSPIELGPTRQARYKIRIELPGTCTAHLPVPVSVTRDYGEYRADYTLDGTTFTAERILSLHQRELPSTRRGDFTAFNRVVKGDFDQTLSVESAVAPELHASVQAKAEELYRSGADAIEGGRYAQAVTLLRRLVELEPTHARAWTKLGRAYVGLHQTDAAIEAFRKQIDLNAYDLYVYDNLGAAYATQQKFSEAEAAFRKQLEINPLDEYAYERLGRLYLEGRKYDAAATELERAVRLSPKKADSHIRLGESYLNLGQRDRALVAFKRAVELDPNPWTWNDVAYQLVLNRTEMDLARRYAESAVAAMDAASRTVSIEHVTQRDLWQTGAMASYWDTLGWVHFANGDTGRAERFVRASWLLDQHAEVGDHLGQIYEKQGRREDAIRAYALALNADRPLEKTRERLAALAGGREHVDVIVGKYSGQLSEERTIALDVNEAAGASADFFVLFGADRIPEAVTFISGDEKLRAAADLLQTARYETVFPEDTPAKILRRGTLSCPSGAGRERCTFTLMLPSDAQAAPWPR